MYTVTIQLNWSAKIKWTTRDVWSECSVGWCCTAANKSRPRKNKTNKTGQIALIGPRRWRFFARLPSFWFLCSAVEKNRPRMQQTVSISLQHPINIFSNRPICIFSRHRPHNQYCLVKSFVENASINCIWWPDWRLCYMEGERSLLHGSHAATTIQNRHINNENCHNFSNRISINPLFTMN